MRSGMLVALLLLSGTTAASSTSEPLSFRLCIEDQSFLPLSNPDPDQPGDSEILLDYLVRASGARITPVHTTWRRCQEWLDAGQVDALHAASYAAIQITIAAFPMRGERPDTRKSLGSLQTELFRRTGTTVDVRDNQFVNLKTRVGILNAYQLNSLSVARLGGTVDDNSRTPESLAQRLLSGQLDLIAGSRHLHTLCTGTHAGKMERLPTPLDEAHYYLAFSKAFYASHRQAVETLWNKLAELKSSYAYQASIRAERARRAALAGNADCPVAASTPVRAAPDPE